MSHTFTYRLAMMPLALRIALIRRFRSVAWACPDPARKATVTEVRLLNAQNCGDVPESTLCPEKFGPFTKSWIAIGLPGTDSVRLP